MMQSIGSWVGKKSFYAGEGATLSGSLLTFRRIDQIRNYIKDNGSPVSSCQRKELQI